MKRRLTHSPYSTVLILILILTFSFIYVPLATSQDSEEIISKLMELQEDVSTLPLDEAFENPHSAKGQRKALTNKIKAVINQIEAGASKGAIKKLSNDLKSTIEAWVTEDYETSLIEKVDEIIRLIKGEMPPPFPDFSIEASQTSLTIAKGGSNVSTLTITSLYGFSELVNLTVSGEPSGAIATLDPTQLIPPPDGSNSSTLTVHVDSTAVPGDYVLTVTGTSGSLFHNVDIELEITAAPPSPDFSITVNPSSLSIQQGSSNTVNITVASLNGFSDMVNLTVSPAIDGVTYSLDPSSVTPLADSSVTSTITIEVAETAIPSTYVPTLTGTSGNLQHSTNLSLEITTAPPPPDVGPPTVRIDEPENGSHLAGEVDIIVFVYDENFKRAELAINDTLLALWAPENVSTGEHSIPWDTTLPEYPDGLYNIALSAEDEAGNNAGVSITIFVDNRPPTAEIKQPLDDAYVKGILDVVVYGDDADFLQMELYISDALVQAWTASGEHTYVWNTSELSDGSYTMKLLVSDKAGNSAETQLDVTVDNTLPVAEIKQPLNEALVKGTIIYVVYGNDTNFDKMMVYIGERLSRTWTESGEYSGIWNSLKSSDGVYQIKLEVFDKAGNRVEKIISATVDNTLPTAIINTPAGSTFLRGTVSINITGDIAHFEEMELRINDIPVESWTEAGSQIYSWNTKAYSDGSYTITLTVYDKAGHNEKTSITTVVDNTAPLIQAPSWEPKEPSVDTPVNITVKVSDIQPGSGIQSVTLWYMNTTMDDWQSISMRDVASGNWTATIPAQSMETAIEFYIEALDNAGNKAETAEEYEYNVIAPTGIPLAWIIVIILLILAATIAAVYFWRKRRREKKGINDLGGKNYKLTILLCF